MRIVVDAMGTDQRPVPDVEGAVLAARETRETIILTGPEDTIKQELDKHNTQGLSIEIVHASEVITMDEKPVEVTKNKTDSSIHVGLQLVKDGEADAFVTAGNTGAAHAIAMLKTLRRIPGVRRPALSAIFPIFDRQTIFLDVGANADSRAEWLAQFALMGSVYAERTLTISKPRIGLLSNGEEASKGNQLIQETANLLNELPIHFIGNVEPSDVLNGKVDVMVSDGFTGNVMIKTFESSTHYLGQVIRNEIKSNPLSILGGLLARGAFVRARAKIDTFEVGGAPLLGVNGVVIISHGSSNAKAIKNAIIQARKAVEGQVISAIEAGIAAATLSI
jgi:phosphate acyltransferase